MGEMATKMVEMAEDLTRLRKMLTSRTWKPMKLGIDLEKYTSFIPREIAVPETSTPVDAAQLKHEDSRARQKLCHLVWLSYKWSAEMTATQNLQNAIVILARRLGSVMMEASKHLSCPDLGISFSSGFPSNMEYRSVHLGIEKMKFSYTELIETDELENAVKLRAIQQASSLFDELYRMLEKLMYDVLQPEHVFTYGHLTHAARVLVSVHELLANAGSYDLGLARSTYLSALVSFSRTCYATGTECCDYATCEPGADGALAAATLQVSDLDKLVFKRCGRKFMAFQTEFEAKYDPAGWKEECKNLLETFPTLRGDLEKILLFVIRTEGKRVSSVEAGNAFLEDGVVDGHLIKFDDDEALGRDWSIIKRQALTLFEREFEHISLVRPKNPHRVSKLRGKQVKRFLSWFLESKCVPEELECELRGPDDRGVTMLTFSEGDKKDPQRQRCVVLLHPKDIGDLDSVVAALERNDYELLHEETRSRRCLLRRHKY